MFTIEIAMLHGQSPIFRPKYGDTSIKSQENPLNPIKSLWNLLVAPFVMGPQQWFSMGFGLQRPP